MDFATFWKTYPHPKNRGSKAVAEQKFNALSIGLRTDMLAGLAKYQDYLATETWCSAMQAQRWLNKSTKNWQTWAEAEKGEDADMAEIQKGHEEIKERNRQRDAAAYKQWQDRYEKQFGWRPR